VLNSVTKPYAMKTCGALDGGEWSASRLCALLPGIAPPPHGHPSDSRLGGPQDRSGRCGEERNFVPAGNRNLDNFNIHTQYYIKFKSIKRHRRSEMQTDSHEFSLCVHFNFFVEITQVQL
jgi:hypothetical protein